MCCTKYHQASQRRTIDNELVRISYVFERNWDSRTNDRAYKAIRRRQNLLIELVRAWNLYDRKTGPPVLETSIKIVRSTFFRYSKINTIPRCRQVSRLFRSFVFVGKFENRLRTVPRRRIGWFWFIEERFVWRFVSVDLYVGAARRSIFWYRWNFERWESEDGGAGEPP